MLGTLLAPVSVDTFFSEYWERAPLHVSRGSVDAIADIYAPADVADALVAGARDVERFALVRAGTAQAPLEHYLVTSPAIRWKATGKPGNSHIDARKVADLVERGYTLVIKDAGLLTPRLQRACNRLQRDLGAYTGANVYLTPAGAQGLDVHHDTHDTLTVQIEGTKTWRVYEPVVPLPLESQEFHRDSAVSSLTPHAEITLQPGDTLYLPRGYAHQAVAGDARALHVTFALAPIRLIDLLHEALDVAGEANVALRRALPRGWQDEPAFATAFAADAGALVSLDAGVVERAARNALGDMFAASRIAPHDPFDQRELLANAAPDSLLRYDDDVPFLIRRYGAGVEVLLPGKLLALSPESLPALTRLQAGPVRFADFAPELAAADRALFLAALVREGVVRIDAKTPPGSPGT